MLLMHFIGWQCCALTAGHCANHS